MGMGRHGSGLEADPIALELICEAMGWPNLSLACDLISPMGMMGWPIQTLYMLNIAPIII